MLFRVQVVPSMLRCRRWSCKLPWHGLDPRIACYIIEAGFEGLFKVSNLEVDHALITALVERWRPKTHTFHLPHGEMGITLQDIEVMLGVPINGLPVTGGCQAELASVVSWVTASSSSKPNTASPWKHVYPCWGEAKSHLARGTI